MNLSMIPTLRPARGSMRSATWLAIVAGALALTSTGPGTAHATIDPGPPTTVNTSFDDVKDRTESQQGGKRYLYRCPLRRVATTFVRCDDLTGNGVPAPAWILER